MIVVDASAAALLFCDPATEPRTPRARQVLHDDPRATSCVVKNLYSAGIGRALLSRDEAKVEALEQSFAAGGYRVPGFLKSLALGDDLYLAPVPSLAPAKTNLTAVTRKSPATVLAQAQGQSRENRP